MQSLQIPRRRRTHVLPKYRPEQQRLQTEIGEFPRPNNLAEYAAQSEKMESDRKHNEKQKKTEHQRALLNNA